MTANDYDPEGGHTREEAEAAFDALYRELHGEENTEGEGALGSYGAFVYKMYMQEGLLPDEETARQLCKEIISATDFLRAEGTTREDRIACAALANIAGVDIEALAKEALSDY